MAQESVPRQIETLVVLIKGLDEKFRLLMDEAEKRNGQRFDAQQEAVSTAMVAAEKAVSAAMAAAEKAVTKAEVAAEKRFESVNEFRKSLADQSATFVTRMEYTVQHTSSEEKIDSVGKRMSAVESSIGDMRAMGSGRKDLWGIITGAMAMLIALATLAVLLVRH